MSSIGLHGFRHESAPYDVRRWATEDEMAVFSSGDPTDDLILAEGAGIDFAGSRDFANRRNRNVMFLASSGAGKTYGGVMPNLVNHQPGSYVVTDTKGELYRATAKGFERDGYEVARLDTIDLERSACYNPFAFVRSEDDIPVVVKMVLDAISPNRELTTDSLWPKSAEMCAGALIGILFCLELINGFLSKNARALGIVEPRYMTMRNLRRLLALVRAPSDGGPIDLSPLGHMVEQLSVGEMDDPFCPGRKLVFEPMGDVSTMRSKAARKGPSSR